VVSVQSVRGSQCSPVMTAIATPPGFSAAVERARSANAPTMFSSGALRNPRLRFVGGLPSSSRRGHGPKLRSITSRSAIAQNADACRVTSPGTFVSDPSILISHFFCRPGLGRTIMRLISDTFLLCMAFPFFMSGTGLSNLGGTTAEDNITAGYKDSSQPATTSGWTDLYSGMIADGAKNSFDYGLPSYSGDPIRPSAPFGLNSIGVDTSVNRDKPSNIAGVTAIVLLIGALRLYFGSLSFRKLLFDTFSPLSPLGY